MQEILDRADEYAERFEGYEPRPGDLRTADDDRIGKLVRMRAELDRSILQAVRDARDDGSSWSTIGRQLGTSGEAARQRYAHLIAS
ncbi:hypothetical protein ABLG96_11210 [Nakamurella sp. A5-74]|uniref:Uncharacterized protein n=1 Tax=Nakamurella sp. A5-74 TaxID=3158264 RepID=A0AAU8DIS7_9ACTN